MTSNNNKAKNEEEEEEIDLMTFFYSIFKVIGNFFVWIFKGFKCAFFALVYFLLFFVKKYYLYVVSCFLVLTGLWLYDVSTSPEGLKPVYVSTLEIEPKFGSNKALYTVVDDVQNGLDRGDVKFIADFFNLPQTRIISFKEIQIASNKTPEAELNYYNKLISSIDTADVKFMKNFDNKIFDKLNSNNENVEYPFQKITVFSTDRTIFKELTKNLLDTAENMDYVQEIHKDSIASLNRRELSLKKNINDLDTLLSVISTRQEKALLQSGSGTLHLSNKDKTEDGNVELDILERKIGLTNELLKLEIKQSTIDNIIVIVKDFGSRGISHRSVMGQVVEQLSRFAIISILFGFAIHIVFYCVKFIRRSQTSQKSKH